MRERPDLSFYVKKIRGYYHRFWKIAVGNFRRFNALEAESSGGAFSACPTFLKTAGKWSKLNRFGRFKALESSERPNLSSYVKKIRGCYHRFWKIAVGNFRRFNALEAESSGGAFSACPTFLKTAGKWSKLNRFGRFKALESSERPNLSSYVKKIRGYYHRFWKIAVGNTSAASMR